MSNEVQRAFGYRYKQDDPQAIAERGMDAEQGLRLCRGQHPTFNPEADPWTALQFQGMQGACAGHAGCLGVQVCVQLAYGKLIYFSRANVYYEAQRKDGIRGDQGSTINGCSKVLTQDGVMREEDWRYPPRYDNRRPANFQSAPRVYIRTSKPVEDPQLCIDLVRAGAAVQTGVAWTNDYEKPVCTEYTGRGSVGGHSTLLFGTKDGNLINHNSWNGWMPNSPAGPGRHLWTENFVKDVYLRDRYAVFMAYFPVGIAVDPAILQVAA